MSTAELYPTPSRELLESTFVGKSLQDVPVPVAILDLAKVKHNCQQMLDAVDELQVSFRAHIKTHKTTELTRLQVGEHCKDVRVLVSTMIEAESIAGLLVEYQTAGARINMTYGLPLAASSVSRLAAVGQKLGPDSISVLIDNPGQLSSAKQFKAQTGFPVGVFIKTDSGYHRAGLLPESSSMLELLQEINDAEQQGDIYFVGFYSHNSLSYNGTSPNEAMDMLKSDIDACRQASTHFASLSTRNAPLIISVGASPTALSIQNIQASSPENISSSSSAKALRETLDLTTSNFELEIHAGVYSVFDLQQVNASSRTFASPLDAYNAISLSVIAEVVSVYPDRTASPEALINAGTLALTKDTCKSYPGWGVITSWNIFDPSYTERDTTDASKRMIVNRISQEHGIVSWENTEKKDALPLTYGQKVRLWPNHACITAAAYGWFLIVDSTEMMTIPKIEKDMPFRRYYYH